MLSNRVQVALAVSVLCLGAHPARSAEVIRLASDDWCPYVCARDGRVQGGLVVELVTRAMATQGIRVEAQLLPLNRAMQQTVSGAIDGVFAPPEDTRLLASKPLGYSQSCFYTNAQSSWRYQGIGSLKMARLGVIGDYEYDNGPADEYIRANADNRKAIDFSYGANAGSTNVKKLLGGRFDVLLEHELVMTHLSALTPAGQLRKAGCLELPFALRVGFTPKNAKSVVWSSALQQGLSKLEESGELELIRQRYRGPFILGKE